MLHGPIKARTIDCSDAQAKSLIGYAIPWAGTERVIYADYSNHLHTLELVPGQHWLDGDLIQENTQVNPQNPPPLANPSALTGYIWNQTYTEHVIYLDCNNGVNELWGQDLLNYNKSPYRQVRLLQQDARSKTTSCFPNRKP